MAVKKSQRKSFLTSEPEDSVVKLPTRSPQTEMQAELQPEPITEPQFEPVLLLEYPPSIPSTSAGPPLQFARMSIKEEFESGESPDRTLIPEPEIISFKSPDEMKYEPDNNDSDQDDDDSETCCMMWIEPCKDYTNYSS